MDFTTFIAAFAEAFIKHYAIDATFQNNTRSVFGFSITPTIYTANAEAFASAIVVKCGLPKGTFKVVVVQDSHFLAVPNLRCRLEINRKALSEALAA